MGPLCIYHGNCADGFGAAWVVNKVFGKDASFHAGVYSEPPPDVEGRDVFLVDFSYKRPVLLEMAQKAKSILILDHHKTAKADLANFHQDHDGQARVEIVFDMEKSGAMLAWEWWNPHTPPPQLIRHIEDRDLWRFALPYTREIQANLFSYPYNFSVWDRLMEENLSTLVEEGRAIERKHFKDIHELLDVTRRKMRIGGVIVPVANLPYTLSSDAGHEMAKGEAFAACYYDTPTGRVFSLRSEENGMDVSEIAKQYGGGGHRNAAGFKVDFTSAAFMEVK